MSRPRLLAWALRIARAPPLPCGAEPVAAAAAIAPQHSPSLSLAAASFASSSSSSSSSSSRGGKQRPDNRKDPQPRRRRRDADDAAVTTAPAAYRHPPREELDAALAAALGLHGGRGARGRPPRSRAPPLVPPLAPPLAQPLAPSHLTPRSADDDEDERLRDQLQRQKTAAAAQQADAEWRARPTVGARRAASHLESALSAALARDAACRDDLLRAHGLVVHAARRSADGREAAVLWDCFPGHEEQCALTLERRAGRLRRAVATAMRGTRVPAPRLVFKLDRLPARAAAVAEALDRAERELLLMEEQEEEEEEEGGGGTASEDNDDEEEDDADADRAPTR